MVALALELQRRGHVPVIATSAYQEFRRSLIHQQFFLISWRPVVRRK
ncbi:MAG TPA: hypothetical protein VFT24_05065 [Vicinamibacterales bacterium]|nr:hypothetical protein [Vicinamibacterales bacterium]